MRRVGERIFDDFHMFVSQLIALQVDALDCE